MSGRPPESEAQSAAAAALREARGEWRVRHMQLTDAMRELRACKARFDETWARAMALWEKTDAAVCRWREAARVLAPLPAFPAEPAATERLPAGQSPFSDES
jgi:hypothetical protein